MKRKANGNLSNEKQEEDWISAMPDEILVKILSHLTLKEAVRTSVVSNKWKNLWKFFTGNMALDGVESMVLSAGNSKKAYMEECKFRNCVNHVLNCHQGGSIQGLRVAYDLSIDCTEDIDRWIELAIIKRVERLELDFSSPVYCIQDVEVMYTYPDRLLELPFRRHYSSFFDNLTCLIFKRINVTEKVVTYFLSNCPLLERLCVEKAPSISHLKVVSAGPRSLKLKQLEIRNCKKLKDLKISAAQLIAFVYSGPIIDMPPLEHVPLLSSLSVGGDYCDYIIPRFDQLLSISIISQLERLVLSFTDMIFEGFVLFPTRFPEFSNLKELEINFMAYKDQSVLLLTSFVLASPRLFKFGLKCSFFPGSPDIWAQERSKRKEERYRLAFSKCLHENLKVVEIRGWVGLKPDFELAMHLLEICVSLEKIIIDPRDAFLVETRMDIHPRWRQCPEKIQAAKERARELAINLPQGVNMIIL